MRLTIELTDFQCAVVRRAAAAIDGGLAEALMRAIAFDAARPVEPRWREPRPRPPAVRSRRSRGPQKLGRPPGQEGSRTSRPDHPRLDAVLAPATGRAVLLRPGDRLTVEQLADGQCVDLTAREPGAGRLLSTARTRAEHGVHPTVGDSLWSEPPEIRLLRIVADTAPAHDLCFPPCTPFEYEQLTGLAGHRSCHSILAAATRRWFLQHAPGDLDAASLETTEVLNLWLASEVAADGALRSWPVACRRGDAIELEALTDVLVTLSTCPDDLFGSAQYAPGSVRLIVTGSGGDPGGDPIRISRAMVSPRSASACHRMTVTVPDSLAAHLDRVRAAGWLGTSRGAVARALLFRWYEATRTGGRREDGPLCTYTGENPPSSH